MMKKKSASKLMTMRSKVKEIKANPMGHDLLYRLFLHLGMNPGLLNNPLIGNLTLANISWLIRKQLSSDSISSLITMVNRFTETLGRQIPVLTDLPISPSDKDMRGWWQDAVFYQIYPKSFQDSNGDGIGDLRGILSRLDYLADLGIDAIWLSPIYDSPLVDNGYDIRDYYQILSDYGTREDFEELVKQVHQRGMRLIMDLVVNHTSDEHPWFQEALHHPDSVYRDYYYFRPMTSEIPPNNWTSHFSGSAWRAFPIQGVWALHLFSDKQMDLNWNCSRLREELYQMIHWWLDKGVDGFRLDVINYIAKKSGLPDGKEDIGRLMYGYCGIEHYIFDPKLPAYLQEMQDKAFRPHQAFSVGETPGIGRDLSRLLTNPNRQKLNLVFSFEHMETPGHRRFEDYRYDLNYLKTFYLDCLYGPEADIMPIFFENHDNPRMISKINPDPQYRLSLAKLLATIQMTMKGIPFLYQGQELALVNQKFQSMEDIQDVESINFYQELLPVKGEEGSFSIIMAGTRDHARTPMPWSAESNGGFTDGVPWMASDDDFRTYNVQAELADAHSPLQFYKKLIALRRSTRVLRSGNIRFVHRRRKNMLAYIRENDEDSWLVICNLSDRTMNLFQIPDGYRLLVDSYVKEKGQVTHPIPDSHKKILPYQAMIWRKESASGP